MRYGCEPTDFFGKWAVFMNPRHPGYPEARKAATSPKVTQEQLLKMFGAPYYEGDDKYYYAIRAPRTMKTFYDAEFDRAFVWEGFIDDDRRSRFQAGDRFCVAKKRLAELDIDNEIGRASCRERVFGRV